MINFRPPRAPLAARKALNNVLQTPACLSIHRAPILLQSRCDRAPPRYLPRPRQPSGPRTAVRTRALIGYARVSTTGQLLHRQQHALAEVGCLRVFAYKLSGKNADRPEPAACLNYLRPASWWGAILKLFRLSE
jgi:hypothetical protein